MNKDAWKPEQYNKFKDQRAQPFWDLADLVNPEGIRSVIDLGCGTGELTADLQKKFPGSEVLGVDNSASMLKDTGKLENEHLHFELQDLNTYTPSKKYDLVFSNAALQWLPDHETLLPKVFSWVAPHGQVAIQMPFNFDHPSHQIAYDLANEFPAFKGQTVSRRFMLSQERYSQMLYEAGFRQQKCRVEIYPHPMQSGRDVIEWTKGTLLTTYQKELSPDDYAKFLGIYSERLLKVIGEGPYLYTFKRLLLWGDRCPA